MRFFPGESQGPGVSGTGLFLSSVRVGLHIAKNKMYEIVGFVEW